MGTGNGAAARKALVRARTAAQAVAARGREKPVKVSDLAKALPRKAWKTVRWREGTGGALVSRFAAVRVRPSHRDTWDAEPWPEEWLLMEWPETEEAPAKFWLSTLPANTTLRDLVDTAKLRWRIERDFQDLKQEIGLDHYEGRGWRGFHHHAALSIAAYGFLVAERSPIPALTPLCPSLLRANARQKRNLSPPRRRCSGLSVMRRTPSQHSGAGSLSRLQSSCRDAPAACKNVIVMEKCSYDTVRLAGLAWDSINTFRSHVAGGVPGIQDLTSASEIGTDSIC